MTKKDDDPVVSEYYRRFRARLKYLREKEVGWTQAQMAEALDVPLENYKKYENRGGFPLHLLAKLAWLTRRDVEFIVTGSSKPKVVRSRAA